MIPTDVPSPVRNEAGFDLHGPAIPNYPVIVSVPHAGRCYGDDLLAGARVGVPVLQRLEDRYADLLARRLIDRGVTVLVATAPRALIDLNRHEREIDPAMVAGIPRDYALQTSAKLRGGLGLFPRRLSGAHELWRQTMTWAQAQQRIATYHQPYHEAVAGLMAAARDRFGHAILIDLHSMPPLPPPAAGVGAPVVVLGDRFGRSAASRLTTLTADIVRAHGHEVAQNNPYAGGYMAERHGRPDRDYHALQIEVDRSLYLDGRLDGPGAGLATMQAMIGRIVNALAVELPRDDYALAAE